MTTAQKFQTAIDALTAAKNDLLDATTGEFKKQPDYSSDLKLLADIEAAYVANGGIVSPDMAKALQGAAAVVKIIGL